MLALPLFGQLNLVPNSSFETGSPCDDSYNLSTIEQCDNWFDAFSSIDWFSSCYCSNVATSFYCPPNLFYGSTSAHTGSSFIGFIPYSESAEYREVPGIKLSAPLIADSAYCISVWIKNSNNHNTDYHISEFQCAFLTDTSGLLQDINNPFPQQFSFTPQSNLNNITKMNEWVEVKGDYIASGGENYLLFGVLNTIPAYYNQGDDSISEERMYYYFDDVSVYQCDKDSINEPLLELPNVFTPNNDGLNDLYEMSHKNLESLQVVILNRWGNVVHEYDGLSTVWNGESKQGVALSEGVYFVNVIAETTNGTSITKHQFVHLIR